MLTDDDVRSLTPPYSCFAVDEGVNLLIDNDSLIRFGNHSCDPNLWMADEVTEVARRPIAAGEEITIDYALHSVLPEWRMECACGSPLCRGTITGNDWMRQDLQRRYGTHFSPFIVRRQANP
ncbi:MAG: SET domain-containing protein-lysine N-methyltransferase [Chloroflexota bacterium]|nr:SET domain-containing protein-lysine N-methyltransferase [Chloroflexota bacterium]